MIINIHCVAHRLALAVGQTGGQVKYIVETFKPNLHSLCFYYDGSAVRSEDMGGMLKRPENRRSLVSRRGSESHKLAGIASSISGPEVFCNRPESTHPVKAGQHNSGGIQRKCVRKCKGWNDMAAASSDSIIIAGQSFVSRLDFLCEAGLRFMSPIMSIRKNMLEMMRQAIIYFKNSNMGNVLRDVNLILGWEFRPAVQKGRAGRGDGQAYHILIFNNKQLRNEAAVICCFFTFATYVQVSHMLVRHTHEKIEQRLRMLASKLQVKTIVTKLCRAVRGTYKALEVVQDKKGEVNEDKATVQFYKAAQQVMTNDERPDRVLARSKDGIGLDVLKEIFFHLLRTWLLFDKVRASQAVKRVLRAQNSKIGIHTRWIRHWIPEAPNYIK
uniref:DUF4371 domain-containing protein n=1 Tax=Branchiostoma floridae TaxID=7739 RepID=C3ZJZ9_BRAFL|eukprot:XP_002591155.1 hypothetical protein BRAFLDRAFT_108916 [Branchiostoma floridae]